MAREPTIPGNSPIPSDSDADVSGLVARGLKRLAASDVDGSVRHGFRYI